MLKSSGKSSGHVIEGIIDAWMHGSESDHTRLEEEENQENKDEKGLFFLMTWRTEQPSRLEHLGTIEWEFYDQWGFLQNQLLPHSFSEFWQYHLVLSYQSCSNLCFVFFFLVQKRSPQYPSNVSWRDFAGKLYTTTRLFLYGIKWLLLINELVRTTATSWKVSPSKLSRVKLWVSIILRTVLCHIFNIMLQLVFCPIDLPLD